MIRFGADDKPDLVGTDRRAQLGGTQRLSEHPRCVD
jgi:hypothetical protein